MKNNVPEIGDLWKIRGAENPFLVLASNGSREYTGYIVYSDDKHISRKITFGDAEKKPRYISLARICYHGKGSFIEKIGEIPPKHVKAIKKAVGKYLLGTDKTTEQKKPEQPKPKKKRTYEPEEINFDLIIDCIPGQQTIRRDA